MTLSLQHVPTFSKLTAALVLQLIGLRSGGQSPIAHAHFPA